MFKTHALIGLLLFQTTFFGCKLRNPLSDTKADHKDTAPTGDQTWTEARLASLGAYAKDLLTSSGGESKTYNEQQLIIADWFKSAGVTQAEPLSNYTIDLGPYEECFSEGGGHGIWWPNHKDQIKRQIEQTAYFIRDYHYAMLGKNHGAFTFRKVILCPEEKLGTKMILKGYNLFVGVPYGYTGYVVLPNQAAAGVESLQSLWKAGYPAGIAKKPQGLFSSITSSFSKEAAAREAAAVLWNLFNPWSTVRVEIRKALYENRSSLVQRLNLFLNRFSNATENTTTANHIRSEIRGQFGDGPESPLSSVLSDSLLSQDFDQLTVAQLKKLIKNWQCFTNQEENLSAIEDDAMMVVQDGLASEQNEISKDVKAGLVAVVNHHRVGVQLSTGIGTFKKYIKKEGQRTMKITTKVRAGLVAVDTSDDITVGVDGLISMSRVLPAAGFATALRGAKGSDTICNP